MYGTYKVIFDYYLRKAKWRSLDLRIRKLFRQRLWWRYDVITHSSSHNCARLPWFWAIAQERLNLWLVAEDTIAAVKYEPSMIGAIRDYISAQFRRSRSYAYRDQKSQKGGTAVSGVLIPHLSQPMIIKADRNGRHLGSRQHMAPSRRLRC